MSIPEYNKAKYYRIMDRTQSNYANQLKRLSRNKKRADFILIYYSLAIIIYALSVKFYPTVFDENWTSYSSMILSIIVLIYSIVNSRSEYSGRITSIQNALNEVKRLKREVGALPEFPDDLRPSSPCSEAATCEKCQTCSRADACAKLNKLKQEYDKIVSNTEIRDDLDFYITILHLCKQHNIDPYTGRYLDHTAPDPKSCDAELTELLGYIAENDPKLQRAHLWLLKIWHGLLYIAPAVIFLIAIFSKQLLVLISHVPLLPQ